MTMPIPIFPQLNASEFAKGSIYSAKAVFQVCASPLLAPLVDRYERSLLLGALMLEICSVFLFMISFDYMVWYCARALSGIASAGIISACMVHLKNYYVDSHQRSTAMGLAITGVIAGVCLGPVVGGTLYELSPTLPFEVFAVFEMVVLCFACFLLPNTEHSDAGADSISVVCLLRDKDVCWGLVLLLVANAVIALLSSTFPIYAEETMAFTVGEFGLFWLLNTVPSCIMSSLAGPLMNSFGPNVIKTGAYIQGGSMMLIPKNSIPVEVVSLAGVGGGMGMIDGCVYPYLANIADQKFSGTGKVYILSNVAVQSGFIIGPMLGNALAAAVGFQNNCLIFGAVLVLLPSIALCQRTATSTLAKNLLECKDSGA